MSTLTVAELQALATEIPNYFPNFKFLIAGQTCTTAQVMTTVEAMLSAANAVVTARKSVSDARVAEQTAKTQYGPFITELRQFIAIAFSSAPSTLAEFLITPKKARTPLTASQRAAAEAKARATRTARGTRGKKQKAAITGNVTGVTITPVTGPTAVASATQPSGSLPAATQAPSTTAPTPAASATAMPAAPSASAAAGANGTVQHV